MRPGDSHAHTYTDPANADADTDPTDADTDPAYADTDADPANADTDTDPTDADTDPAYADTDADPANADTDTDPANADAYADTDADPAYADTDAYSLSPTGDTGSVVDPMDSLQGGSPGSQSLNVPRRLRLTIPAVTGSARSPSARSRPWTLPSDPAEVLSTPM